MTNELLSKIAQSVVTGDPGATLELTTHALEADMDPLMIVKEGLTLGMKIVGDKFGAGEYFLPNLLIAAKAMQGAMDLLEPRLGAQGQRVQTLGRVVIGTVSGDIHEIGKSLVGTMMSANGFEVHDLGVDVPIERFIEKVKHYQADLLGLSSLLTTTMTGQRKVIEALEQAGLRGQVKVIVGGAPVTPGWAQDIGADGYAEDAIGAVRIGKALLGK